MHKKIAFVSDAVWPYNTGGKEKRLFDISTRLAEKGHRIHIYTMKWWTGPDIKVEHGVTLHALCRLYPLYSGSRRSITEGLLFGLACFRLITESWDIVDVDHMPFFPLFSVRLVCLLKKEKMIATWHEVWGKNYWRQYLGRLGSIAYLIEKTSVLMPDKITSVSGHTTKKLRTELSAKKEIVTIPDGIDISHIRTIKPSSHKSDVIFSGRLLSHKNIDILIKAIAIAKNSLPRISCLIIGDGPEKVRLEHLVKNLNLNNNIHFPGFLENHDDVCSLIKSSQVFVLPSTREGFGIVAIESHACGTPVITINHPDNAAKDLISEGKNGFICDLDDRQISERIINIVHRRPDKKRNNICIDSAGKFDLVKITNDIERVYSK